jgi:hypothetical protein
VGFDHDDGLHEPRDKPVAGRETPALGRLPRRCFRQHGSRRDHAIPQITVALGVGVVDTAGGHTHRGSSGDRPEGALVRGSVDAEREARHDADAGSGEVAA